MHDSINVTIQVSRICSSQQEQQIAVVGKKGILEKKVMGTIKKQFYLQKYCVFSVIFSSNQVFFFNIFA